MRVYSHKNFQSPYHVVITCIPSTINIKISQLLTLQTVNTQAISLTLVQLIAVAAVAALAWLAVSSGVQHLSPHCPQSK